MSLHWCRINYNEMRALSLAYQVGGVRYEFGKPQTNATIVYFYRRRFAASSILYSIMKYETTPDESLFNIPTECQKNESGWKVEGL